MHLAKAAMTKGDGSFEFADIQVYKPRAEEVLVEVRAAGICHTDYDSLSWGKRFVLGHEGAGVVVEVGSSVTHVNPGDRVVLNWAISCGCCYQCRIGNHALCEEHSPVAGIDPLRGHAHMDGSRLNGQAIERSFNLGTLSSLTLVRREAVVPMPAKIPFASACILGCGVMTGFGSVVNAARVAPGSTVVVLGCGGVGLNVIQGARIAGALKILAVDLSAERLKMAEQFGATQTFRASRSDKNLVNVADKIRQHTGGRGADYAFEATANPALGAAPLAMIRHGGMAVQVSGIEQELKIDMRLFEWDKTYINPLYGKCCPEIDFPRLFQLYEKGDLLLDELVTRTYPLENLADAFTDMHRGRIAKGVVLFEE